MRVGSGPPGGRALRRAGLGFWWRAGMNKMVINHLDKLFVTSDAAVIVRELEVAHEVRPVVFVELRPAARERSVEQLTRKRCVLGL